MTAPWPGRWLPTGTAPITHCHQGLAPSQHLGCPPEAVAAPRHSKPRPQATQAHTGGFSTPFPTFPNASIKGSGQQSPPPPGQHGSPSPLHALAVRPGIPAHSPELSSAGCWGRQQPSVPHPGANPRPLLKPPSTLQSPPHRAPGRGWRGTPPIPHPHPICCPGWGKGRGWLRPQPGHEGSGLFSQRKLESYLKSMLIRASRRPGPSLQPLLLSRRRAKPPGRRGGSVPSAPSPAQSHRGILHPCSPGSRVGRR